MKTFCMKQRDILLDDSWDVIVVGGGPAGAAAAAAAAREGARTLLVEATGALGGMGTSGLVPAWCPFTDDEKFIYSGLARRVFEDCKAGMPHVPDDAIHGWLPLDPERLKRAYDQIVTESGVTVLFGTQLCDVSCEDGHSVEALVLSNKAGLQAVKASVYIDATGDADLAAWAGAEYEMGSENGDVQPMTHCFILSNVDSYYFQNFYDGARTGNWMFKESPIWAMTEDGDFPRVKGMCANLLGPSTVGFNAGHVHNLHPLDPYGKSKAYMEGRRIASEYRDALAKHFPQACANAYLAATGSLMGVRETRRIKGDYRLTIEDYANRRSFPDEISRNAYIVDIHCSPHQMDAKKQEAHGRRVACYRQMPAKEVRQVPKEGEPFLQPGESHGIPYRCLTPQGLRNVLVAGRAICCDRTVQGSVRVMPVCLSTGEAAGIASFMALRNNDGDVHAVDTETLRNRMREEGAYLPEYGMANATN